MFNWIHSFTSEFASDDIPTKVVRGKTIIGDPRLPRLVEGFYTSVESIDFPVAQCLLLSHASARLLDLEHDADANYFIKSRKYFAMNYGGYQFGQWNGQLGDGRVLHHGDLRNASGQIWDIAIKGVGKSAFSRHGDGLLTLKSAVREYLGLEYLTALGIPSTRALAVYSTGDSIVREGDGGEQVDIGHGGIIARLAPSWIRFGSFELFYLRGEKEKVKRLADYVINTHYPNIANMTSNNGNNQSEIQGMKNRYAILFEQIVNDSAILVAHWQAAGFVHGLLNSENISIHGISMHLGPFAFLDVYDPSFAPSLTDYEKRFKFESQPDIISSHLSNLGKALSFLFVSEEIPLPLLKKWMKSMTVLPISSQNMTPGGQYSLNIDHETLADMICRDILSHYNDKFLTCFTKLFQKKLGLVTHLSNDLEVLITPLLQLLANCRADYTCFFRLLSSLSTHEKRFDSQIAYDFQKNEFDERKSPILHLLISGLANFKKQDPSYPITEPVIAQNWIDWAIQYRKRLLQEYPGNLQSIDSSWDSARSKRMNSINPKYSLKSWILSEICESLNSTKLNQAVKILIHDMYGDNDSDYSVDDRRVSNAWSHPCYDYKSNEGWQWWAAERPAVGEQQGMDWSRSTGWIVIDSKYLNADHERFLALIHSGELPIVDFQFQKLLLPLNLKESQIQKISFNDSHNVYAVVFKSDILVYSDFKLVFRDSIDDVVGNFQWIPAHHVYVFTGNICSQSFDQDFTMSRRVGPGIKGVMSFAYMQSNGQFCVRYTFGQNKWNKLNLQIFSQVPNIQSMELTFLEENSITICYKIYKDHRIFLQKVLVNLELGHTSLGSCEILHSEFRDLKPSIFTFLNNSLCVIIYGDGNDTDVLTLWEKDVIDSTTLFFDSFVDQEAGRWKLSRQYSFTNKVTCVRRRDLSIWIGLENGYVFELQVQPWNIQERDLERFPFTESSSDLLRNESSSNRVYLNDSKRITGPIEFLMESPNDVVVISTHRERNGWQFRVNHFLGDLKDEGNLLIDLLHVNSILSFVNKTDEKDLASFAAQISKFQGRPHLIEDVLLRLFKTFESRLGSQFPMISSGSVLQRLLRYQLLMYKYGKKQVQYINTLAVCEISFITEKLLTQFSNPFAVMESIDKFSKSTSVSTSSGFELIVKDRNFRLEKESILECKSSICWIMEFSVFLLRQVYIITNLKKGSNRQIPLFSSEAKPTPLIFFFHPQLLMGLKKAICLIRLIKIYVQIQLARTGNYNSENQHIFSLVFSEINATGLAEDQFTNFLTETEALLSVQDSSFNLFMWISGVLPNDQQEKIESFFSLFSKYVEKIFKNSSDIFQNLYVMDMLLQDAQGDMIRDVLTKKRIHPFSVDIVSAGAAVEADCAHLKIPNPSDVIL